MHLCTICYPCLLMLLQQFSSLQEAELQWSSSTGHSQQHKIRYTISYILKICPVIDGACFSSYYPVFQIPFKLFMSTLSFQPLTHPLYSCFCTHIILIKVVTDLCLTKPKCDFSIPRAFDGQSLLLHSANWAIAFPSF